MYDLTLVSKSLCIPNGDWCDGECSVNDGTVFCHRRNVSFSGRIQLPIKKALRKEHENGPYKKAQFVTRRGSFNR